MATDETARRALIPHSTSSIELLRIGHGTFNLVSRLKDDPDVVVVQPIKGVHSLDTIQRALYRELFPSCEDLQCDVFLHEHNTTTGSPVKEVLVADVRISCAIADLYHAVYKQHGVSSPTVGVMASVAMGDLLNQTVRMYEENKLLHLDPSIANIMVSANSGRTRLIDRWIVECAPVSYKMTTCTVGTREIPTTATQGYALQVLCNLFLHLMCVGVKKGARLVRKDIALQHHFFPSKMDDEFDETDSSLAMERLRTFVETASSWSELIETTNGLVYDVRQTYPFDECPELAEDLLALLKFMMSGGATFETIKTYRCANVLRTNMDFMYGWVKDSARQLQNVVDKKAVALTARVLAPVVAFPRVGRAVEFVESRTTLYSLRKYFCRPNRNLTMSAMARMMGVNLFSVTEKERVPFYTMLLAAGLLSTQASVYDSVTCQAVIAACVSANQCDVFGRTDTLFGTCSMEDFHFQLQLLTRLMITMWPYIMRAIHAESCIDALKIMMELVPWLKCEDVRAILGG